MENSLIDIKEVVNIDQERMGGEPCFKGTRVPVKTLFDHIGKLDEFFDGFPSVTHEQVDKVLSFAGQLVLSYYHERAKKITT